jgi:acyl-CoA thioesterase I
MKRILFFGDSLTAGYGLAKPAVQSLPGLIQKKIDEAGLQYQVVNAGISGDTSSGGLARLDYWLNQPVDIFVLELGVNDLWRGAPYTTTKHNLDLILKKVKERYPDCKLVIMGMEIPDALNFAALNGFRKIYRELAEAHSAAFVPFFLEGVAGVKHLNLPDGLHPSARGYEVIAEKVWPTIKALLASTESAS